MNKRLMITTAAAIMAASMAFGQSQQDSILTQLTDQGYSNIQIKVGATTIKVEAVLNGMKREFTVNIATGAITGDHTKPVGAGDSGMTAIGGSGGGSSDDNNNGSSSDDSSDDDSGNSSDSSSDSDHSSNSSSSSDRGNSHQDSSNDSEGDD